ncbi:MAG: GNAT family N-acetyltransferase [Myxococcota bacterium]
MSVAARETTLAQAVALGREAWRRAGTEPWTSSPFGGWAWHAAWLRAAEPERVGGTRALVATADDGSVRGLLPLRARTRPRWGVPVRTLGWATGDDACPDHRAVAVADDHAAAALVEAIADLDWDVLALDNLAEDDPGAERLLAAMRARGWDVRVEPCQACPVLDLPGDWEAWLASLSGKRRQTIRRKERKAFRDHDLEVIHHAGESLDEGWRALVALHERRWDGDGAFDSPRDRRFHEALLRLLDAEGALWLTTVRVDGRSAAAWYGMAAGDTVYFYQSGRDPETPVKSLGSVLHGLMIRYTMERGFRRYDFLRGDEDYKDRWATRHRTTRVIRAYRPTPGGRFAAGLERLAERARPLRRSIRARTPERIRRWVRRLRPGA